MKSLLIILAMALCGCTSTTIYGPDGSPRLRTTSNLKDVSLTAAGDFRAAEVNNSVPTAAAYRGLTNSVMAAGSAAMTTALVK